MKEKGISKRSISRKHGIPEQTFRDMTKPDRTIDPYTGYPKLGHKNSHKRILTDKEENVSFI